MKSDSQARLLYSGFRCGRFYRFDEGPFEYLNGSEFVQIIKNKQTGNTVIRRSFITATEDMQVKHSEIEEINLRKSDEIRIYKEIKIAKDNLGSKLIQEFSDNFVMQPHAQNSEFFHFTFDYVQKKWIGKWASPKRSQIFSIKQNGQVYVELSPKFKKYLETKFAKKVETQEKQKQIDLS